ncbi:MAG: histidinol-phosphatase HisJ family protein [Eubacterium sp.]|nr:histidinol-phosphatase HisJ family protein [Eubacterium sp.]
MWDMHMHSSFSGDSEAEQEDMIKAAINQGLDGLCFTDHHDIDYPKEPDEPDFLIDFEKYFPAVRALREKYAGRINILCGIELGLQKQVAMENEAVVKENDFDFVIGSIHAVDGMDPYYGEYFKGRSEKESVRRYFEATLENVKEFSEYDVLGHLDYMVRYMPGGAGEYNPNEYMEVIDEIFKIIIPKGKGIEINTSGFKAGLGFTNPHEDILKRYKELGGEIITTGADAHVPEYVGYKFSEAKSILAKAGFKRYCVFEKRQPKFYEI